MRGNRKRDTQPELRLRSELHRIGLRFRVHLAPAGTKHRADIVFSRARIAVFVDGCFWHGCAEHGVSPRTNAQYWRAKIRRNKMRDDETTANLVNAGWRVVRVWEHESPGDAARRIKRLVERAQRTAPSDETT